MAHYIKIKDLQCRKLAAFIAGVPESTVDAALASGVLTSTYDAQIDDVLVSIDEVLKLGASCSE